MRPSDEQILLRYVVPGGAARHQRAAVLAMASVRRPAATDESAAITVEA